jgi:hypothetical protein
MLRALTSSTLKKEFCWVHMDLAEKMLISLFGQGTVTCAQLLEQFWRASADIPLLLDSVLPKHERDAFYRHSGVKDIKSTKRKELIDVCISSGEEEEEEEIQPQKTKIKSKGHSPKKLKKSV